MKKQKRKSNDKRKQIIVAAFKEFYLYGLEQSSTNRIVDAADVSKGLLYHYFDNKENLHAHLLSFSNIVIQNLLNDIKQFNGNLFETVYFSFQLDLKIRKEFPYLIEFYYNCIDEQSSSEKTIKAFFQYNTALNDACFNNYEHSSFKNDSQVLQISFKEIIVTLINGIRLDYAYYSYDDDDISFDLLQNKVASQLNAIWIFISNKNDEGVIH